MRRLKTATRLWKIQPQWVVTPGKQTTNHFRENTGDVSILLEK